ncbi:hypothetical protein GGR53DRAFT_98063 [Hypoxylon sp. FL1150]|nr:hypothetical protein GGR53DRAFT_98063 [Hypoxylon sp. FL1150]
MAYLWGPARALRLAAVLAATASSASFIRPSTLLLLSRADNTCAADNFTKCTESGLPDNFCCETGSTCLVLAGNTTILCCPEGSTCAKISAITCDITLQDASTNPAAEIKTTALDSELAKCGDLCCPFGYHCDGTICVKDDDQSQKPTSNSTATSSAITTPTPTADPTSSATVSVSGITTGAPSTTETPAPSTESTSNTVKVVGGVVGGVIGLVIIIVAVVACRFKRRKQQQQQGQGQGQQGGQGGHLRRHNSSTSSFGNIIVGEPKPHPAFPNQRIDFLAKQQSSTISGSPRDMGSSSLASSSPYGHQYQQRPQTPQRGGDGDHQYENDFGFMPPNSPYSPFSRRPDSTMSDAPRSYHQSAEINGLAGLRNLTSWKPNNQKTAAEDYLSVRPTPPASASRDRDRRQPSSGSESINIFADPGTFGGSGARPTSTATTWSNIQQRADRNTGVPPPPLRRT